MKSGCTLICCLKHTNNLERIQKDDRCFTYFNDNIFVTELSYVFKLMGNTLDSQSEHSNNMAYRVSVWIEVTILFLLLATRPKRIVRIGFSCAADGHWVESLSPGRMFSSKNHIWDWILWANYKPFNSFETACNSLYYTSSQ